MKTKQEIKSWMLENCIDEYGVLDLSGLDFSDFDGNVFISYMKVKETLFQNCQQVKKDLFQDEQEVKGNLYQDSQDVKGDLIQNHQKAGCDLFQDEQEVKGNLYQDSQDVKGDFVDHKLEKDEKWKDCGNYVQRVRVKFLKPITAEELAKMGYELKEDR